MKEPRAAFYALRPGGWRDVVTLLHPPYTLIHLSFVVLGAAFAPEIRYERLIATLVAFFLAVGVAAHFLDELHGRPLRTTLSTTVLKAGATAALIGACAIGVAGAIDASPLLLGFVAIGAIAVVGYNLELLDGALHNDLTFAVFWGAFPFLTANWVMDESFDAASALGGLACLSVAMLQRSLSNSVRRIRRRAKSVEGTITYDDGSVVELGRDHLLATPEKALSYLSAALPLLAAAAVMSRLLAG
jgi:hypothetical protein